MKILTDFFICRRLCYLLGEGLKKLDVVIVGGGLGGLSCAAKLIEGGKNILLLDANKEPGGHLANKKVPTIAIGTPILEQLRVYTGNSILKGKGIIHELVGYIEGHGGEIVCDAPVTQLSKHPKYAKWMLTTPWGKVNAVHTAIMLPKTAAYALLKTGFGGHPWFEQYVLSFNAAVAAQNISLPGLYLSDGYPRGAFKSYINNSLFEANRIASRILEV